MFWISVHDLEGLLTKWKRAVYHAPPADVPVLVCYGSGHMMVSSATYYNQQMKDMFKALAQEGKMTPEMAECKGYFKEFGQKVYLDDADVYWTELPEPPKESNTLSSITEEKSVEENEEQSGGTMTVEELAKHFGEKTIPVERGADEIYAIAARVKNACVLQVGANLTPAGVMLCNTYTHTIKAFYDFAKTIKDEDDRERLKSFIMSQEGMAATFVGAAMSNVKAQVEEQRKRDKQR
jgi:hypothetical protein